ncbi:hypothetical protein [Bacillus sp. AFS055030]|uniref:hypothetical protein n=1 Tax=Bacillus sp. AFS055030 TaxID=2033507 RepID=UPI000BFBCC06|nr:hypothetical protein [Bacillus sp. AFS055030]PGL72591.1 hypothetical protein CN925_04350 [Bacillus sp. AFS055030]
MYTKQSIHKLIILLLSFNILVGCTPNKQNIIKTSKIESTKMTNDNSKSNSMKSNIVTAAVAEAEQVPKLYFKFLNEKKYDDAIKLLGPTIAFYGDSSSRKYLENLKHTTFLEFKDITSSDKFRLSPIQEEYYAVKAYYAKINNEVSDPELVPMIIGINYRLMIVIKETKNSQCLLDSDETIDPL